MFLWCVRDGWRQGQTVILTQHLLLTIACCVIFKNPLSTSSTSWLGLLNWGSFSVCKLVLTLAFLSLWLNIRWYLPIFFHNFHLLLLLLPHIYTDASLIDGSVKGQYITLWTNWLGLRDTLTASLQRGKTPPVSVLDMTLNNLMVRLQ